LKITREHTADPPGGVFARTVSSRKLRITAYIYVNYFMPLARLNENFMRLI